MTTNTTNPYPQIQAIEPTANMQFETKQLKKVRNQTIAIFLTSIAIAATTSTTVAPFVGVAGFALGFYRFSRHKMNCCFIDDDNIQQHNNYDSSNLALCNGSYAIREERFGY